MTLQVRIDGSTKPLIKDLRGVQKKAVPVANVRTLNKGNTSIRSGIVKRVAKEFGITQKRLRRRIKIPKPWRATRRKQWTGGVAMVAIVPVAWAGRPRQTKEGARVGKKSYPGEFVVRTRSGHVGVFRRTQPSRRVGPMARSQPHARGALPIKERMMSLNLETERAMRESVREFMDKRLEKLFAQELTFALSKYNLNRGTAR